VRIEPSSYLECNFLPVKWGVMPAAISPASVPPIILELPEASAGLRRRRGNSVSAREVAPRSDDLCEERADLGEGWLRENRGLGRPQLTQARMSRLRSCTPPTRTASLAASAGRAGMSAVAGRAGEGGVGRTGRDCSPPAVRIQ
jgi:hypothetical protein